MLKIEYALVDSGDLENDHWAIQIKEGEFVDHVFRFLTISPVEENDLLYLNYDYEVLEAPEKYEGEKLERFHNTMGNILQSILDDQAERENNDKNRNNHTSKLDLQSRIHAEDFPLPEE